VSLIDLLKQHEAQSLRTLEVSKYICQHAKITNSLPQPLMRNVARLMDAKISLDGQ